MRLGFTRWLGRKREKNKTLLTLSDIIRGIHHSVNASAEIAQQHHKTNMANYFDDEGRALSQRIKVGDNHIMDVPLICLTGHNALDLDEIKVKMNVEIRNTDVKRARLLKEMRDYDKATQKIMDTHFSAESNRMKDDAAFEVSRGCFDVEIGSPVHNEDGGANVELVMYFKSVSPPEAVSRIIDRLNNAMIVRVADASPADV